MDIRAEILKEHSKQQSQNIARWVGNDEKRFAQLIDLFLNDEYLVVQRASWIVNLVNDTYPGVVLPYLSEIVNRMAEPGVHVAVRRNVVRMLQYIEIPEGLQGQVMNACFEMLADPKETIGVRCFSMTVLDNLSRTYPEMRQELTAIIEGQLEQEASAGFKARARKILKR